MKIEIIDENVHLGGDNVGTIWPNGAFKPNRKLHHNRVAMIEREISKLRESSGFKLVIPASEYFPKGNEMIGYQCPPPEMDWDKGDKTPSYVEWFRSTHTPEEFQAKYGHRKIL